MPEESSIYQGKLEELIVGDFVLVKDDLTKQFHDLQVTDHFGQEFLYYRSGTEKFKGSAVKFHETVNGGKVFQIDIPVEGPNALKGYLNRLYPEGLSKLHGVSFGGYVGEYDSIGNLTHQILSELNMPTSREDFIQMENRKGLFQYKDGWLQIGLNPSSTLMSDPKERLATSRFPLGFQKWLAWINVETGEVNFSDFTAPSGYKVFENDMTSTYLYGAFDSERKLYYLGFPYSDTLFQIKNQKLISKVKPEVGVAYNFIPSEVIPWGESFTVWAQPKEASAHLFLLYDKTHDLFVRATKIKESGEGEMKFERTKHYVLSIYSGDWEPKGEYFFDYKGRLDLENWFLTSQGLFLSKPEQPNEDEYEFYRVDLSRFGGQSGN
ncbi:hypothetical protein KIH41_11095 [Litoribacter ruber]|uniref:hypothetical protein n=1 Tax=Litoribacter ruber TaxID=702568 RepID=UPI001BDAF314|nr:hypothetical protein [Litoribacter ruber]MBT0811823.1 hypothetical protein [Litoribacter ruber]